MTYKELQKLARSLGIKANTKKGIMIKAIKIRLSKKQAKTSSIHPSPETTTSTPTTAVLTTTTTTTTPPSKEQLRTITTTSLPTKSYILTKTVSTASAGHFVD